MPIRFKCKCSERRHPSPWAKALTVSVSVRALNTRRYHYELRFMRSAARESYGRSRLRTDIILRARSIGIGGSS
jgi:hypothetical protein